MDVRCADRVGQRPAVKAPGDPVVFHDCPWCKVRYLGIVDATHCGTITCTAKAEWTPERWDGQRRMAEAREAARSPLDGLDREALSR